jgi:hypothetical protein
MSFFRFLEKMPINRSYFTFPFLDKKSIPHQKDLLEKKPVVDLKWDSWT